MMKRMRRKCDARSLPYIKDMAKEVAAVSISGPAFQVTKQGDLGEIEEGGDRDSLPNLSKIRLSGKEVVPSLECGVGSSGCTVKNYEFPDSNKVRIWN
jgi:hypothetical protein